MIPGNQPDVDGALQEPRRRDQVRLRDDVLPRGAGVPARGRRAARAREDGGRRPGGRRPPPRRPLLPRPLRASRGPTTSTRSGPPQPEEGVVDLALGLGKTIVDGGLVLDLLARLPDTAAARTPRPATACATPDAVLGRQHGPAAAPDPIPETEYLVEADLGDAEADGVLATWSPPSTPARTACGRAWPAAARACSTSRRSCVRRPAPRTPSSASCSPGVRGGAGGAGGDRVRASRSATAAARRASASCRCARCASSRRRCPSATRDLADPRALLVATRVLGNGRPTTSPTSSTCAPRPSRRGTRRRSRASSRPSTGRSGRGRPALPADRLRPLGQQRPLARRAGGWAQIGAAPRDRRGDPAGDGPRAEPGLALLPQPDQLLASCTSRCRYDIGRAETGLAGTGSTRAGPHETRCVRHVRLDRPLDRARGRPPRPGTLVVLHEP